MPDKYVFMSGKVVCMNAVLEAAGIKHWNPELGNFGLVSSRLPWSWLPAQADFYSQAHTSSALHFVQAPPKEAGKPEITSSLLSFCAESSVSL